MVSFCLLWFPCWVHHSINCIFKNKINSILFEWWSKGNHRIYLYRFLDFVWSILITKSIYSFEDCHGNFSINRCNFEQKVRVRTNFTKLLTSHLRWAGASRCSLVLTFSSQIYKPINCSSSVNSFQFITNQSISELKHKLIKAMSKPITDNRLTSKPYLAYCRLSI